jgi:hypothetical protein
MHTRGARARDCGVRPRAEDRVLCDERAVEVDRERGEGGREAGGELYGSVPPVDFTTYAATSAICWAERRLLNDGIWPPPFVTCAVTAR